MTTTTIRPLTDRQRGVMRALRDHSGLWADGGGWVWSNYSDTVQILRALEKKGLVRMTRSISWQGREYPKAFALTDAGRAWLTENMPTLEQRLAAERAAQEASPVARLAKALGDHTWHGQPETGRYAWVLYGARPADDGILAEVFEYEDGSADYAGDRFPTVERAKAAALAPILAAALEVTP